MPQEHTATTARRTFCSGIPINCPSNKRSRWTVYYVWICECWSLWIPQFSIWFFSIFDEMCFPSLSRTYGSAIFHQMSGSSASVAIWGFWGFLRRYRPFSSNFRVMPGSTWCPAKINSRLPRYWEIYHTSNFIWYNSVVLQELHTFDISLLYEKYFSIEVLQQQSSIILLKLFKYHLGHNASESQLNVI